MALAVRRPAPWGGAIGQRRSDVDVLGCREGALEGGRAAILADLLKAGADRADGCGLRLPTLPAGVSQVLGRPRTSGDRR
jgi:hypothetical protein